MRTQSVLVAAVVGVVGFLSLAQRAGAAVITYLSSMRYISANTSRVDAVGFADFNETVFFSTPPTGVGTSQASQQSQLLPDRIVARCATRTTSEFFMLPPAFLVAQSFLDVTFRIEEPAPFSIYTGEFRDETNNGFASAVLFSGVDLSNVIAVAQQQGPPISGMLGAGDYRFRVLVSSSPGGGGGGDFGSALATATLVVPSPSTPMVVAGVGLWSIRRRRTW